MDTLDYNNSILDTRETRVLPHLAGRYESCIDRNKAAKIMAEDYKQVKLMGNTYFYTRNANS